MVKNTAQRKESDAPSSSEEAGAPKDTPKSKTKKEKKQAPQHTPMMEQFFEVKARHPDCILFYRMGDFYEMFMEDAVKGAKALDIALTKRGKANGQDIPMCGVPVHSHETYLSRLIKAGYNVAICEQIETPEEAKKRGGYKALVKRDVVRIITPGTLTEDNLLDNKANNYLACASLHRGKIGLSWLDLSTGRFFSQNITAAGASAHIERIAPSELIISETLYAHSDLHDYFESIYDILNILPNTVFDAANAQKRLHELYQVQTLDAYGAFSSEEVSAAGCLIDYAQKTQKGSLPYICPLQQIKTGSFMEIDAATRKNLELSKTIAGERKGSLLECIDRTLTSTGGRLLKDRLSSPSCDVDTISHRLSQVDLFVKLDPLRQSLRDILRQIPDMERALSRLSLNRGNPKDMGTLRDGLGTSEVLLKHLQDMASKDQKFGASFDAEIKALSNVGEICGLIDRLHSALDDELPFQTRDGQFIRAGYSPQIDELRKLKNESKSTILALQADYIAKTNVPSLKIKFNNVLGYFIEVSPKHADPLMVGAGSADNPFVHRQTLASAVRFTTPELSELETKIMQAGDRSVAIEVEIFEQLRAEIVRLAPQITDKALAIAEIDLACAFAELAIDMDYTRPVIDDSLTFDIKDGRHPVVEHSLRKDSSQNFIPNDCALNNGHSLWVLTGPNMAGKSTFLRQNALIAILAQCGSFVPAKHAHIGVIDKVFSRVGASDDLARGRSTFMVEMVETAAILNQSTQRSLVILDEIGRGTATFDGLSIAWGTLEYLHDVCKCRGLFATHYHELTTLQDTLSNLSCHRMNVKEWKGEIIFMHQVVQGAADQSYGIHVARLAGLPPAVISRANDVLTTLQESEQSGKIAQLSDTLPLFQAIVPQQSQQQQQSTQPASSNTSAHEALDMLEAINPDDFSPKDALEYLYQLKEKL